MSDRELLERALPHLRGRRDSIPLGVLAALYADLPALIAAIEARLVEQPGASLPAPRRPKP